MPRLVAGNVGQSYIVRGYSNGSESNGDNHLMNGGVHGAATPQYRKNRTMSETYIAEAPSSGGLMPQLSTYLDRSKSEQEMNPPGGVPRTPSSLKSTSGAPSSLKTTRSLFATNTINTSSRRHSSVSAISPKNTRAYASDKELPTTHFSNSDMAPRKPNRILRAAEGGKGTLLPDFNRNNSQGGVVGGGGGANKRVSIGGDRTPPDRTQTRSSPSLKNAMNLTGKMIRGGKRSESHQQLPQTHQDTIPKPSVLQAAKQSIRRRNASSCPSGDEYDDYSSSMREISGGGGGAVGHTNGHRSSDNESTSYHSRSRDRRRGSRRNSQSFSSNLSWKISTMKLGNFLQVVIVLAVTALVWESHHKALFAAQQLTQFKEEESLLLLHLQKIEQQSIQLHENLGRLAESGMKTSDQQNTNTNGRGGGDGGVDFDLIHKQTQQLYQMEEELNQEVKTLQQRIQQSARKHVIQEFGEGPVQVILEIDFGNNDAQQGPKMISILLWHDTPHAAWTWLEQIGRHVWDNSEFSWEQGHAISATPSRDDPMAGGKIEFVEQSQHGHEAWTVGLHENDAGKLSMYINLGDNTNLHKHETCVGKVIDGFDAMQKLLEVARNRKNDSNKKNLPPIQIRKATAMHVTKKEQGAQ